MQAHNQAADTSAATSTAAARVANGSQLSGSCRQGTGSIQMTQQQGDHPGQQHVHACTASVSPVPTPALHNQHTHSTCSCAMHPHIRYHTTHASISTRLCAEPCAAAPQVDVSLCAYLQEAWLDGFLATAREDIRKYDKKSAEHESARMKYLALKRVTKKEVGTVTAV